MKSNDKELKTRMLHEAARVSAELEKEPGTIAVILTGPLALGIVSPNDKLYFAVIKESQDGAIEHHFLDEGMAGVERPIEIGRFPLHVARFLVEHGYRDMVSYKSLEAFRCGQVLFEKEGIGSELIEGAAKHIPERQFVGESLHGAVSALDDALALLKNGDFANAVLVAREAALKAVDMVIATRLLEGDISFVEAARRYLPQEQFERFSEIMGIEELDEGKARTKANEAKEFAAYVLRQLGVNPDRFLESEDKRVS